MLTACKSYEYLLVCRTVAERKIVFISGYDMQHRVITKFTPFLNEYWCERKLLEEVLLIC